MRPRIKTNKICSSKNYKESKKVYARALERWHEEHKEEIEVISASISVKRTKYISVFGKLIPVSEEELKVHETLITWNT